MPAPNARYIVCEDGWGHIFDGKDGEVSTKWAYDTIQDRLVRECVLSASSLGAEYWRAATPEELADIDDSVSSANREAFEDPGAWGLTAVDELPLSLSAGSFG